MIITKQGSFRRVLSLLLAVVMCLSMVSVTAFAEELPYRTVKRDGDEMSLTSDNATYYFDTVDSALTAVENTEFFSGDLTLTLLADSECVLEKSRSLFKGYNGYGTVTLDINGKSLTFKAADGVTSRCSVDPYAPFLLTDNTASGSADEDTLNSGSVFLSTLIFRSQILL